MLDLAYAAKRAAEGCVGKGMHGSAKSKVVKDGHGYRLSEKIVKRRSRKAARQVLLVCWINATTTAAWG
jgi:hypothetical protein